ncbi:MAG: YicC family protein [Bacteroidetes bacterium GWF2_49_14]|nr:MAG: YicC family protein [Bacteroidetes bacterium GWF2_49_14]
MTGFGKATRELENKTVNVEVKCLNSKQADIFLKLPALYREGENEVRNEVSRSLQRGKIEVAVWIESTGIERNVTLNEGIILDYLDQVKSLGQKLDLPGNDVLLPLVMRLPDVVKVEKQDFKEEEWKQIFETIRQCVTQVEQFRIQEGNSIESDFRLRISNILEGISKVRSIEKNRIERIREKMNQALADITERVKLDQNRFEQELIYYIEKLDINEEMVRLKNHCDYFIETLETEESPGRKLGFISQEIGREINTIGSKANDSDIQRIVVGMKDELEKIKEQSMNVL